MKTSEKRMFIVLMAVAMLALWVTTTSADMVVTLYAGQDMDVGTLTVAGNLTVTYELDDPWELVETHLAVASTIGGIPTTKKGNPIPGKFPYSADHDPGDYMYTYYLGPMTLPVFIAAHAAIQKEEIIEEAPYYAASVVDSAQGLKKGGTAVDDERSTPEQGLVYESGASPYNFFSLGFGGWIIVEFDCPIRNGEGNDVKIIEDTWGGNYPLEEAEVYASQDGIDWTFLGSADNKNLVNIHTTSEFDLGTLPCAKYIKVVDITDPEPHNNNADAYDLNAVEALHDCVEIVDETAWGDGERFEGAKSWGMFFEYSMPQ